MNSLKTERSTQKALISTTSEIKNRFESNEIVIDRVLPQPSDRSSYLHETRAIYVVSFQVDTPEPAPGVLVEDFSYIVNHICTVLSILFGKRFNNHGMFEQHGWYSLPNMDVPYLKFSDFSPFHSKEPRWNYSIPLDLREFSAVEDIFVKEERDMKFVSILLEAGKYYAKALRIAEEDPEIAYLHLITSVEILSNYFDYEMKDLISAELAKDLEVIKEKVGEKVSRKISSHLRSLKAKSVKTMMRLIDDDFFLSEKSKVQKGRFLKEDIESNLKSAYDLRSKYVHSGLPFGQWSKCDLNCYDLLTFEPNTNDKSYNKVLKNAPTLTGLESIVRYCLLQFMKKNGLPIPDASKIDIYWDTN